MESVAGASCRWATLLLIGWKPQPLESSALGLLENNQS